MQPSFTRIGPHAVQSSAGFVLRPYPGRITSELFEIGEHALEVKIESHGVGRRYVVTDRWLPPHEEQALSREQLLLVVDHVAQALDALEKPYELWCPTIGRLMHEGDWGEDARRRIENTYLNIGGGAVRGPIGQVIRWGKFPNVRYEAGEHVLEVAAEPGIQGRVYTVSEHWRAPFEHHVISAEDRSTIVHDLSQFLILTGEAFDLICPAIGRHVSSRGWKNVRRGVVVS